MNIKIIGALFVIIGCGGFGLQLAANHRYEERVLKQLISCLDYMECELQYRLTPLPDLCRQASKETSGVLSQIMLCLATELEDQISPDAASCMYSALQKIPHIPQIAYANLKALGKSLGRFDLSGQLNGLEAVRTNCRNDLQKLQKDSDNRLRSYQTLGLCAGAALAIIFI